MGIRHPTITLHVGRPNSREGQLNRLVGPNADRVRPRDRQPSTIFWAAGEHRERIRGECPLRGAGRPLIHRIGILTKKGGGNGGSLCSQGNSRTPR